MDNEEYYPLGEFCRHEECFTKGVFDFNMNPRSTLEERIKKENLKIQRETCKSCMGYRYYEGSRNGNKPA